MAAELKPYTPDEVVQRLQELYGAPEWRPHGHAMSELVLTLLSQNTSDTNSGRAFSRLLQRFPDWPAVLAAPLSEVEDAIRPGGLAPTKAPRLQAMLAEIQHRTGGFDLRFLEDLPVDQARDWLRSLPAVGPKTAACVLMFGLGMPGLPVDTHVHRVSIRLGLVGEKRNPEQAQLELEARVPASQHYMFHILLIRHGRHMCTARAPACSSCPLLDRCPAGQTFVLKKTVSATKTGRANRESAQQAPAGAQP